MNSPKLRVLIVEDNIINQRVATEILKKMGHTGVVVGDGQKAMMCLEKLTFDLILLDVMMPIMDGMEALANIRQKEAQGRKKTPIIMCTAHDGPGEAARMKKAGADGFINKPITSAALQTEFNKVLSF